MKHAIKHKTAYSALGDLLDLLSLHLPTNSSKDHLKPLYFLKKSFSSKPDNETVETIEYCPDCAAPYDTNNGNANTTESCEYCVKARIKKDKNYFLTLDIGKQIQNLFQGKPKHYFA